MGRKRPIRTSPTAEDSDSDAYDTPRNVRARSTEPEAMPDSDQGVLVLSKLLSRPCLYSFEEMRDDVLLRGFTITRLGEKARLAKSAAGEQRKRQLWEEVVRGLHGEEELRRPRKPRRNAGQEFFDRWLEDEAAALRNILCAPLRKAVAEVQASGPRRWKDGDEWAMLRNSDAVREAELSTRGCVKAVLDTVLECMNALCELRPGRQDVPPVPALGALLPPAAPPAKPLTSVEALAAPAAALQAVVRAGVVPVPTPAALAPLPAGPYVGTQLSAAHMLCLLQRDAA